MLSITDDATISASTMERLEAINESLREIDEASRAPRTIEAYQNDWVQVQRWAASFDLDIAVPEPEDLGGPLPLLFIRKYLAERQHEVSAATLSRHLAAIRHWHHEAELMSPTDHPSIAKAMSGIKRLQGQSPRRMRPVYFDDLTAMIQTMPANGIKTDRDKALLLAGWWGAFRRSELAGLDVADLEDDPQGLIVKLARSKTDQEGKGRLVPLHYHEGDLCPVIAVRSWAQNIDGGPLFRHVDRWGNIRDGRVSGEVVATVVKEAAERIGQDPSLYSGHSLRAGFVSECDRRGIATSAVRLVTGHKSDTMLNVYTRPRSLFDSSAGAYFDGKD